MSNLKKIIALSVAAATSLSMFASAVNFVDADDISSKNEEAVNALVALNVINGIEDAETGEVSFDPMGEVTRAQMAKMIYVIMNGGEDDGATQWASLDTDLTDVNGHWAEGYIKFCEYQGIIVGSVENVNGVAKSVFNPENNVTGTQAMKMALVVLGYNDEKAGLVGSEWDQNVLRLAQDEQLHKDANVFNSPATREQAAQILFNMLNANTVIWNEDNNQYIDNTVFAGVGSTGYTITAGQKYMNLGEAEGVVLTKFDQVTVNVTNGSYNGDYTVVTDLFALVGQEVDLQLNTNEDEVYGATANKDVEVYEEIAYDVDYVTNFEVEDDTVNMTTVTAYIDGVKVVDNDDINDLLKDSSKSSSVFKFIDNNDDGNMDAVSIYTKDVAEVSAVNDERVRANATDFTFEDDVVADDIATGDFVVLSKTVGTDEDGDLEVIDMVEKAETVTGEVNAIRDNTFRIEDNDTFFKNPNSTLPKIEDTIEFANVDGLAYYVEVTDEATSVEDYTIVQSNLKAQTDLDGDIAYSRMLLSTGSTKTDYVSNVGDKAVSASTNNADNILVNASVPTTIDSGLTGVLYTYEENDDGNVELTVAGKTANGAVNIDVDSDKLEGAGAEVTLIADDATIFVEYNGGEDFDVITGEEFAAWDYSTAFNKFIYVADEVSGIDYVTIAYVNIGATADVPGTSGDTSYGYVTANSYEVADDMIQFTAWNGTEEVTVKTDIDNAKGINVDGIKTGDIVSYKATTTAGEISDVVVLLDVSAEDAYAITGVSGSNIKYYENNTTAKNETITDDTVILYVNTETDEGSVDGSVTTADVYDSGEYYTNAFAHVDGGDLVLLVVDEYKNFNESDVIIDTNPVVVVTYDVTMGTVTTDGTTAITDATVTTANNTTDLSGTSTIAVTVTLPADHTALVGDTITVTGGTVTATGSGATGSTWTVAAEGDATTVAAYTFEVEVTAAATINVTIA